MQHVQVARTKIGGLDMMGDSRPARADRFVRTITRPGEKSGSGSMITVSSKSVDIIFVICSLGHEKKVKRMRSSLAVRRIVVCR